MSRTPVTSRARGAARTAGDQPTPPTSTTTFLGIEGGGTHTTALLADPNGRELKRAEAGIGNLRLLTDDALLSLLQTLASAFPTPTALGIGLAGAREETDRSRIRAAAAIVWPGIPSWVGNDLDTALAAAAVDPSETRVLILSGTGSCCYGMTATTSTKVGGWGHLLGDRGSAYDIGLRALQTVLRDFDDSGKWPSLGVRLLHHLELNEPNQCVDWVRDASKSDVADLAIEVFSSWGDKDPLATSIVEEAATILASDALACANRLAPTKDSPVRFVLAGGTLLKQPAFSTLVSKRIVAQRPTSTSAPLHRESFWGAVEMARHVAPASPTTSTTSTPAAHQATAAPPSKPAIFIPQSKCLSPTEQRNPRSTNLDKLPLRDAIELMLSEDTRTLRALKTVAPKIEKTVRLAVAALRSGGRILYAGAGTSGRLGVLDASECPPTFRTPPDLVQGIIAGGQTALWKAAEGAEDDAEAGRQALLFRNVAANDLVVGIAASGRTPFVWGALDAARNAGARTVLFCFNPELIIPPHHRPDVLLVPPIGPELLTGSTRLKAGTATKLVLNIITTLTMVWMGKVVGNLMVDVNPSNVKLRDRAVRITRTLTGATDEAAQKALNDSGWIVKEAIARLGRLK